MVLCMMGGASAQINTLKSFLDGIEFCNTGITLQYTKIVQDHINKKDSEYQKYLQLKAKFEK